jgi:hypothetical protein
VSYDPTGLIANPTHNNEPLYPAIANTGLVMSSIAGVASGMTFINDITLIGGVVGTLYNFGLVYDIADVRIAKSATGSYFSGDEVTFTIDYGNYGPQAAENVIITDIPGTGFTRAGTNPLWT